MRSEPQRVVFVEVTAGMGGVEYSTLYLAQHLDRSRWQPVVICPQEGALPEACRQAGVEVHIVPRPGLRSTSIWIGRERRLPNPVAWIWNLGVILGAAFGLTRFFAAHEPALVVTKGLLAHFYGGLAARWLGIPCLWHVQDFISERFGGIYRRGFGQVARWLPSHIVVDGSPIADQLPMDIQDRVTVVLNGVDTAVFRPGIDGSPVREALGIPERALVIGHVARMTPWKGQHHLLEAFARLATGVPDSYLLFVGSALFDSNTYERGLHQRTKALGLVDRVIFSGYRTDLPQVLAAVDLFAHTSTEKDTSPLALLSAMAMGLPVVAFDIEGVREVIGQDGTGVLVPLAGSSTAREDGPAVHVEGLARALRSLLVDAEFRRRSGHRARSLAETRFSLERYVSQMESVLGQMRCET